MFRLFLHTPFTPILYLFDIKKRQQRAKNLYSNDVTRRWCFSYVMSLMCVNKASRALVCCVRGPARKLASLHGEHRKRTNRWSEGNFILEAKRRNEYTLRCYFWTEGSLANKYTKKIYTTWLIPSFDQFYYGSPFIPSPVSRVKQKLEYRSNFQHFSNSIIALIKAHWITCIGKVFSSSRSHSKFALETDKFGSRPAPLCSKFSQTIHSKVLIAIFESSHSIFIIHFHVTT